MPREKTAAILLRLTPQDKEDIDTEAKSIGLNTSAFLLLLFKQFANSIRFEKKNAKSTPVK